MAGALEGSRIDRGGHCSARMVLSEGDWSGRRKKESYSLVGKGSELSFGLYARSSGLEDDYT